MSEDCILNQAAQLECLLPKLMRRLFTLDANHPAMELPLAQLRVCTLLQAGPRTITALSEELGISLSAVTQLADRLERVELVERVVERDDRRIKKLQLTPPGAEMMHSRRQVRVRRAADALRHLSPEMRETVLHALQALVEAGTASAPEVAGEDAASDAWKQPPLGTPDTTPENARLTL